MSVKDADAGETAKAMAEPQSTAAHIEAASEIDQGSHEIIQLRAGSLAYSLVKKLQTLSYDKQRELLDFAEFLEQKPLPKRPRRSFMGALSHLNIPCSTEDIAEARREMWGNFPRDFPDG
jgi:Protein of unknown function (DUF2281)